MYAKDDRSQVSRVLSAARTTRIELPSLNIAAEAAQASQLFFALQGSLDTSPLVDLRRAHESERAAKGVRTGSHTHKSSQSTTSPDSSNGEQITTRRAIIREMASIIREQQDNVGTTSGLNRQARIQEGSTNPGRPAGNSANAALAAGQRAMMVRTILRCSHTFGLHILYRLFGDAQRSSSNPKCRVRLILLVLGSRRAAQRVQISLGHSPPVTTAL